jgi:hypothetical protein
MLETYLSSQNIIPSDWKANGVPAEFQIDNEEEINLEDVKIDLEASLSRAAVHPDGAVPIDEGDEGYETEDGPPVNFGWCRDFFFADNFWSVPEGIFKKLNKSSNSRRLGTSNACRTQAIDENEDDKGDKDDDDASADDDDDDDDDDADDDYDDDDDDDDDDDGDADDDDGAADDAAATAADDDDDDDDDDDNDSNYVPANEAYADGSDESSLCQPSPKPSMTAPGISKTASNTRGIFRPLCPPRDRNSTASATLPARKSDKDDKSQDSASDSDEEGEDLDDCLEADRLETGEDALNAIPHLLRKEYDPLERLLTKENLYDYRYYDDDDTVVYHESVNTLQQKLRCEKNAKALYVSLLRKV